MSLHYNLDGNDFKAAYCSPNSRNLLYFWVFSPEAEKVSGNLQLHNLRKSGQQIRQWPPMRVKNTPLALFKKTFRCPFPRQHERRKSRQSVREVVLYQGHIVFYRIKLSPFFSFRVVFTTRKEGHGHGGVRVIRTRFCKSGTQITLTTYKDQGYLFLYACV